MFGILTSLVCLLYVLVSSIHGTSIASIAGASWPGVVIGKRYLLFAPSALDQFIDRQVKVGSNNNDYGDKQFDIKGFVPHPNYTPSPGVGVGRTGKDNKDNIALVIVAQDLPIGRDNVEQANLPGNPNFNTVGPAYVLTFGFTGGRNYTKSNIMIHSKADCQKNHGGINCTTNLWATAIDSCEIEAGSPVFSGDTLIGTIANSIWCSGGATDTCDFEVEVPVFSGKTLIGRIADSKWCKMAGDKHLFINSLPHYEKWIKRAISDEETFFI